LELQRYELSPSNDKITYDKHCYNGFSGAEGAEAYRHYLSGLYNDYFSDLRKQIDTLALSNIDVLLRFLQTKIDLFNDINDTDGKNCLRWVDYESFKNLIERDETVDKPILERSPAAKNEYGTMKFFVEMIAIQNYFIQKGIDELTQLYNTYNPQPQPQIITENVIEKEKWENTLTDYPDILTVSHLMNIFKVTRQTIYRWEDEGRIKRIDKGTRPRFLKSDIKKNYLKIKEK